MTMLEAHKSHRLRLPIQQSAHGGRHMAKVLPPDLQSRTTPAYALSTDVETLQIEPQTVIAQWRRRQTERRNFNQVQ
jgi:hypothetical protein